MNDAYKGTSTPDSELPIYHAKAHNVPHTNQDPPTYNGPHQERMVYAAAQRVYVQWLYQDKIFIQQRDESRKDSQDLDTLFKCYVFGEKIQDVVFQNTVIDSIFACVHEEEGDGTRWYPTDADTLYEGTPQGSPLKMLIVDMFIYHGHQDWIKAEQNADFLVDLAKTFLELRPKPSDSPAVSRTTSSVYHKTAQEVVA
ncbi:hypothetical protein K431DRAFT_301804 [Polychaeton citri CBS 116435]|uniref:Uncharacterized protein n=1 Tax=Polychaeton citri CBS 116435 TaxID=1314669 RepID=A0A9P4QCA2_9PEZI|nr:hypothetical protein K431DRAFT_301804 [Polychaeton citri CBS 116435]